MSGRVEHAEHIVNFINASCLIMFNMKYETKSVMIGRKPRIGDNEFKTATIALFSKNNPHKCGEAPIKVLDFENIEKIRLKELRNVSYYLEGNDIVVNDLVEVEIMHEDSIITLTGKQEI